MPFPSVGGYIFPSVGGYMVEFPKVKDNISKV